MKFSIFGKPRPKGTTDTHAPLPPTTDGIELLSKPKNSTSTLRRRKGGHKGGFHELTDIDTDKKPDASDLKTVHAKARIERAHQRRTRGMFDRFIGRPKPKSAISKKQKKATTAQQSRCVIL